ELASYDYIGKVTTLAPKSYLIIAKLTAILRVANGLDRSHKQKFKDVTASYDKDKLIITICSNTDITLEQGLFREKAELFEEVFSVRPVIRQKRKI
ncbi:MAG: exopolyphosphatase, partial [Lachnospiraceae bacterium]|nr:exopolyphosphatase [Lachnospiraceae bacterium]